MSDQINSGPSGSPAGPQQPWGSPPTDQPVPGAGKPGILQRRWVQIVGTATVALLLGSIAGGAGASSANDKALAANKRADAADALQGAAQQQATQAKADAATAIAQAKTSASAEVADQLTAAQKTKADADAAAKTAADAAAKTKADLDARAAALTGQEADAKANEFSGDGVYRVPEDVKPGTYKADAAAPGSCYYSTLKGLGGSEFDNIITNGNSSGPVVLVIKSGVAGVRVSGCGTFHKVG